jgi:hypothetical protein
MIEIEHFVDKCDYYGENYQWCNTGSDYTGYLWDTCTPKSFY